MKIKKILAGTVLLGLCALFLFCPVQTQAAEESQATTIVTEVPKFHTVKVVIEGQGTVKTGGKTYSGTQNIQVGRLEEQDYRITAADDWKLKDVTYGVPGSESEVKLKDSVFTAPALYEDGNVLTVTFVKASSETDAKADGSTTAGGQTSTGQTSAGQSPKTGDASRTALWASGTVLSLVVLLLGTWRRKKTIRQ